MNEVNCSESDAAKRSVFDQVVMLPPYMAKEHRQLLDDAEKALEDYSEMLLSKIKRGLFGNDRTTEPRPENICKAERAFLDDPVRQQMVRNLGEIKMLVERPRILVKGA